MSKPLAVQSNSAADVAGACNAGGVCAADLGNAVGLAQRDDAAPAKCDAEFARRLADMDPKEVFGAAMAYLADRDDRLSIVVSDYGRRLSLDQVQVVHPEMIVQCGIAEQSQVGMGAAMALEGLHVIAPAYACFLAARAMDQVRVAMGIMQAPLVLVGLGPGYASGILGASHMALEDVACMRAVPGVDVVCPADNAELWCCLIDLGLHPRPCYVRMPTAPAGALVRSACEGVAYGKAYAVMDAAAGAGAGASASASVSAADVAILATGSVVLEAVDAAKELQAQGISCEVIEVPWVVPFDTEFVPKLFASRLVVTVEEHRKVGGLGSVVAESLVEVTKDSSTIPRLLRLGAPDDIFEADDRDNLLARAGLTADDIAKAIQTTLK